MRLPKALLTLLLTVLTLAAGFPAMAGADDDTGVRVLSWNILHGGREPSAANLPQLLDQVVDVRPDVFFAVETYGSGQTITDALTKRANKGRYNGIRITGGAAGSDNLWIFTRYEVVATYPKPQGGTVTDFNLGGVRVRLPRGGELNLFAVWLPYTNPWNGYLMDENAADRRDGRAPRHSVDAVVQADRAQTRAMTDILDNQLPKMLGGNGAPVLLGGDFNTAPAADWTQAQANCPNHFGLSYPLRTTAAITRAGFVDTYRAAQPDVCAAPGSTWSPLPSEKMITPQRIDFIFARGQLDIRSARLIDRRMPQHGPGVFYSDHAALVTELNPLQWW
ncbi:endonuclease/exonuclease/phosphatase family protein [Nocardia sp. CDC159]|uniref:Endonuclease/exonuclease/phosphatase family protein n=1 Tax=Nocardia pulmonis TaxID=2951408 RepID=A0A9X2ECW0_9NOCA|nr:MULTISPECIES: endonuclease/exonuclease/phosphatase family protein [Nocardia]MCM6775918.1 endonuclease/exonuclease/phosphatase family protein [Nocardia pulmonis]MCM6788106.1 endonuclease/exonuclease/phosphatase family protein [Nocardia sp. CDC159]